MCQGYPIHHLEYELVKGKCSITDANAINPNVLVGCLMAVDGKCLNCANGFVRKAELCLKGVKECMEYNKDGTC